MVERTADALRRRPGDRRARRGSRTAVTRQPLVARRAEELLGAAVVATAPVAGGDIATATKLRLTDGTHRAHEDPRRTRPTASSRPRPPGCAGSPRPAGVAVPEVLGRRPRLPDPALGRAGQAPPPTPPPAFGRALATTHAAGAASYGAGARRLHRPAAAAQQAAPTPGRSSTPPAGCCPTSSWPATAAPSPTPTPRPSRRVVGAARRRWCPRSRPARLHGDLWNGNVLWGPDGAACVIDPAAHGGHRETDLAMLALFGLPHLPRVLDAYDEAAPARRRLGGPGRRCTSCSRCSCTPACSAAGTAPAPAEAARRYADGLDGRALSVPAQARAGTVAAVTDLPRRARRRPRVLVVDDDKAVRESLRRSLEFNGYDVVAGRRRRRGAGRDRRRRPRRRRDGRDDAAARRHRGHPRAAHRRQRRTDPGAHRARRGRRPGRGARRRRRRLPHQAVRAAGAAGPAARAAAPRRARPRTPTTRSLAFADLTHGPRHPRGAPRRPRRSS